MVSNKYPSIKQMRFYFVIFGVFLLLQFYTHIFVPLFGDDYYYASFLRKGLSFFIRENIIHYTSTNGRAFIHLLNEIIISVGPNIWWFFNTAVIGLIVWYGAAIASSRYSGKKGTFGKALVVFCCLFSFIPLPVARQSIYWATGSFNYLFPMALIFAFFYYYKKDIIQERGYKWLCILSFLAAFTVEQAGMCAVLVNVYIFFELIISGKKPKKIYYLNLAASIIAYSTVYFAPGNQMRRTYYPEFYQNGIVHNIKNNIKPLVNLIFGSSGIYIFLLMILSFCIILALDRLTSSKAAKSKRIYFLLVPAFFSIIAIYYYVKGLTVNTAYFTDIVFVVTVGVAFLWFFIVVLISFFQKENTDNLYFVLLAPLMQCVMLLSPEFGPRTVIISGLLLFVPLTYYIIKYFENIFVWTVLLTLVLIFAPTRETLFIVIVFVTSVFWFLLSWRSPSILALIIFIAIAFAGLLRTAEGYKENHPVHIENARLVAEHKRKLSNNGVLLQKYLVNTDYKYTMPYDDPYHLYWYKILNGIDPKTEIIFENYK